MTQATPTLRIGTRGSRLALWQAQAVQRALQQHFPQLPTQLQIIRTTGDKILDKGLSEIGDKGLFTNELEQSLRAGAIDAAVHSMKDVPTALGAGMILAAVLPRERAEDVWISRQGIPLEQLPPHARVGTSSLRRQAQLRCLQPEVTIVTLRGNVETRLRKMEEQQLDGILLAYAGVKRLGLEARITQILSPSIMLPAVAQGAIGIETTQDSPFLPFLQQLHDTATGYCIRAERAFLERLGGGCQVPLGATASWQADTLLLHGRILSLDGSRHLEQTLQGAATAADALGRRLAEQLLDSGAGALLADIQRSEGK